MSLDTAKVVNHNLFLYYAKKVVKIFNLNVFLKVMVKDGFDDDNNHVFQVLLYGNMDPSSENYWAVNFSDKKKRDKLFDEIVDSYKNNPTSQLIKKLDLLLNDSFSRLTKKIDLLLEEITVTPGGTEYQKKEIEFNNTKPILEEQGKETEKMKKDQEEKKRKREEKEEEEEENATKKNKLE
jgi:hypothetical protein